VRIEGLPHGFSGPMTLGFRAEDARIVPSGGQVAAPVYSIELLGEASMISYRIGDSLVSIKAPKEFRAEIDDVVHASVPAAACHVFDTRTGKEVWAGSPRRGNGPAAGGTLRGATGARR
jgi:multiple sugar transport system ATP-binding protein